MAPDKPVHTDHPLRHFDRTCPACIAEQAVEAAPTLTPDTIERLRELLTHEVVMRAYAYPLKKAALGTLCDMALRTEEAERHRGDLLARIFRDGGQKAAGFPTTHEAVEAADAEVARLFSHVEELERRLREVEGEDCEDCDHGIRGGKICESCNGAGRVLIADLLAATQRHVKELKQAAERSERERGELIELLKLSLEKIEAYKAHNNSEYPGGPLLQTLLPRIRAALAASPIEEKKS